MRKIVYVIKTNLVYTLYPRIAAKCYYDVDDYANRNVSACVFLADRCVDGFCTQIPRRWSPNV